MYYSSHHNAALRHAARERDIARLHTDDGLVGRLVRSLRRR